MTLLVTGGNIALDWFATTQTQGEPVVTLNALTDAGKLENLAAATLCRGCRAAPTEIELPGVTRPFECQIQ
jgi:hypothetical protein